MKAHVWKVGSFWHYRTFMPTYYGPIAVTGFRLTWREAFDAACQELKWMGAS